MSSRITFASKIELLSGQHIEAAKCNTAGEGIPYLTGPSDFSGKTPIATKYTKHPKVCCCKGDILITVKGSGTGSIAIADREYCISRQLMAIRCKDVDPTFVQYLLEHNQGNFNTAATGLIPGISRIDVQQLTIPPLNLSEQIAIASMLSSWDIAIEETGRLIQLQNRQKVALVNRVSSFSKRELNLGRFLTPKFRPTPKPNEPYWALGIRSHGKGTFQRYVENPQSIDMEQLYMVRRDDLIINITFAWEGAIAIVGADDEQCLVSHRFPTYEFDRSTAIPEFVKYIVNRKEFFSKLSLISPGGAGRNRVLNKKDFLNLKVRLPEIREQARFARLLNAVDKVIELENLRLQDLKHQKRGLMQKLLTGEWPIKTNELETTNENESNMGES